MPWLGQHCTACVLLNSDRAFRPVAHCNVRYCLPSWRLDFAGEGIKTIVPARASVKLAARLVPDQSPDTLLEAIKRYGADSELRCSLLACNCLNLHTAHVLHCCTTHCVSSKL